MGKRRTLSEVASDYRDALLKIHNDPRTVKIGKQVLRCMMQDLERVMRMGQTFDRILTDHQIKVSATNGRPLNALEDVSWFIDARRYYDASWERAIAKVADEFNEPYDTVKKRVERGKKIVRAEMHPSAMKAAGKKR